MHHIVIIIIIVIVTLFILCFFHNITCYTNPLLSCIHVNATKFLNITCTFGCHKRDIMEFRVHIGGGLVLCSVNRVWQMGCLN